MNLLGLTELLVVGFVLVILITGTVAYVVTRRRRKAEE